MATVPAQNFRAVDRLLDHPSPEARHSIEALGGREHARTFLRYQASERNRIYFETWEIVQLILGSALFFLLLFGTTERKFTLLLALLMVAVVAIMHFILTPEIVALGRLTDFAPAHAPAPERQRLWMADGAYLTLKVAKWVLGLALAGKFLLRSGKRSDRAVRQIDVVNESDYGHVNG